MIGPMSAVLSIDLAFSRSQDFGVCVLKQRHGSVHARFLSAEGLGICDPLDPVKCANSIQRFCHKEEVPIVFLDGPQGWKCPRSPLPHSRLCERLLNTQAKTGVEGSVKPQNFTRFVEFSIAVFKRLCENGAVLVQKPIIEIQPSQLTAIESYPRSAWAKLGLPPLPGKKKATTPDVRERYRSLELAFKLSADGEPTHDQLCALVAGLAGLAILSGNKECYIAEGAPPKIIADTFTEGYIVNPRRGHNGR